MCIRLPKAVCKISWGCSSVLPVISLKSNLIKLPGVRGTVDLWIEPKEGLIKNAGFHFSVVFSSFAGFFKASQSLSKRFTTKNVFTHLLATGHLQSSKARCKNLNPLIGLCRKFGATLFERRGAFQP